MRATTTSTTNPSHIRRNLTRRQRITDRMSRRTCSVAAHPGRLCRRDHIARVSEFDLLARLLLVRKGGPLRDVDATEICGRGRGAAAVDHGLEDVGLALGLRRAFRAACSSRYENADGAAFILLPDPFVCVAPRGGREVCAHGFIGCCAAVIVYEGWTKVLTHDSVL